MYSFLADLVVALHFLYIAAVLLGLLLILIGGALGWRWVRNFWFRAIHLLMIAFVVFEALMGIVCPLTAWEYELRLSAGEAVSDRSFIGQCLHDLIFVTASPAVLTACYAGFCLLVILSWFLVPPRRPRLPRLSRFIKKKNRK